MYKRILTSFLLLTLFAVSGDVSFAATKKTTKIEVADPVKNATVNLYCRMRVGKTIYATSGSGVFISESGIILTNAHVAQDFLLLGSDKRIDGWCGVRTGSPAKEMYTAAVLYLPAAWVQANAEELAKGKPRGTGEHDFALLYVTGMHKKGTLPAKFPSLPLNLSENYVEEAGVTVSGYPTEKLSFSQVRNKLPLAIASTTVSAVRSYSGKTPDLLTLAASSVGNYGASGGPVTEAGKVTALITSKGTGDGDRTLRAITIPYINRTLQAQTGFTLTTLIQSNPSILAGILNKGLTPEVTKIITSAFLKKK